MKDRKKFLLKNIRKRYSYAKVIMNFWAFNKSYCTNRRNSQGFSCRKIWDLAFQKVSHKEKWREQKSTNICYYLKFRYKHTTRRSSAINHVD